MARLSYILMDVLDDDSSEARTDQRIRLLDRVMRLKAKPGVVVVEASDADVDGGLYRPEDWRSEQIQDYAARTCQTACLAADCQTCVGAEPDEGRVAFVTERRFKPARPVRAVSAAPLTKDADTLMGGGRRGPTPSTPSTRRACVHLLRPAHGLGPATVRPQRRVLRVRRRERRAHGAVPLLPRRRRPDRGLRPGVAEGRGRERRVPRRGRWARQ